MYLQALTDRFGDKERRQLGNTGVMGRDLDGHLHRFMKLSIECWVHSILLTRQVGKPSHRGLGALMKQKCLDILPIESSLLDYLGTMI